MTESLERRIFLRELQRTFTQLIQHQMNKLETANQSLAGYGLTVVPSSLALGKEMFSLYATYGEVELQWRDTTGILHDLDVPAQEDKSLKDYGIKFNYKLTDVYGGSNYRNIDLANLIEYPYSNDAKELLGG